MDRLGRRRSGHQPLKTDASTADPTKSDLTIDKTHSMCVGVRYSAR